MKKLIITLLALTSACALPGLAEPALTIYNQNFAVVRDTVPLDLKAGVNNVSYTDATAQVEPDSVILRDPTGRHSLQILEQNYRNDPVTQGLLLSLFEGKTIDFERMRLKDNTQTPELIPGKIIRSGYVPGGHSQQPIIEVNGKLQFSLPGQPLFPDLGNDTVLKPTLNWLLRSNKAGKFNAEVNYITGGLTWEADYNLVSPEKGDRVDLVGWITMKNQCGRTFRDAKIKLMAGDVNKIQPQNLPMGAIQERVIQLARAKAAPVVTEKAFDEYHLYNVAHRTTLRDHETKQVEFVHAENVQTRTIYVYDGALPQYRFYGGLNENQSYGTECNKDVRVTREFVNSATNHLGIPLPAGKIRFYRRDADRQLEFVGEDRIDHTPRDETIRVTTGNAFDLVGERTQTRFHVDSGDKWMDESFAIKLRNHKKEPVKICVVEHLYRCANWEITAHSDTFLKKDAHTIEFLVQVKPDVEKIVTYTVHYSW